MENIEIGKRIKHARSLSGMTLDDIAHKVGVAKSTVQRYENGKIDKIKLPVIESIASALNVNPAWLIGKTDLFTPVVPFSAKGLSINVLGRVAAGIPIEAITDIIDTEEISAKLAQTGSFFGLRLHGDSMEPRMCDGDVVIVRQQDDAESGDVVIALVDGEDATCKRIRKYRDGIELISNNPAYPPMFFSNEEIQTKPVKIIGKVVELRGKF